MFSEPVVGEKFFGRDEVLELLNKRVMALKEGYRQNMALTGYSLSGKSSILHQFLCSIKEDQFIPVYVEVTRESFESFSEKFIATLLFNAMYKIGERSEVDLTALLEKSKKLFPKTYALIKHVNAYIDRKDFDEAYTNLLGLTSSIKAEINMPCIVILDEFDNLEYVGVKNPFLSFGKVIMVQKDTMYIVSSSRNQAIKKIISEKLSLLFGNFEIVKVSGFDLATSKKFIEVKLAGFEITDTMKRFLISLTDSNPFYLDKLVSRSREIAYSRMTNYVDEDIVAAAILDLVYHSNGVIHQYLLNYILNLLETRARDLEIAILLAIANNINKQSDISRSLKIKRSEISKRLARLADTGLISKNGVFYKIDDTLLEFWIKFVYQRRKTLLVNGPFDKMKLFTTEIRSYMSGFVRELESDHAAKLAELFGLFANELVQIDSRYIKLPHFTRIEVKTLPDSKQLIVASARGRSWIIRPHELAVGENDIIDYIRSAKSSGYRIANMIIISLSAIDENARLLAKELKISIWDINVINMLLKFYGKKQSIVL